MRNKDKKNNFDAVKFMRETRDWISRDIKDMDSKQLKEYFWKAREKEERVVPCRKA